VRTFRFSHLLPCRVLIEFYFRLPLPAALCKDNRIYPGRPVLVSGDCKRETGEEHAGVIQTVLNDVNNLQETTRLQVVCIASDGESRRGAAFILLTFKHQLSSNSPIYPLLKPLTILIIEVGPWSTINIAGIMDGDRASIIQGKS